MARSQDTEVAVIESRQFWLVEPLDDGQDGGVHKSNVSVVVTVAELPDAPVVLGMQSLSDQRGNRRRPLGSDHLP